MPQIASSSSITLRPYQLEALDAIERALKRQKVTFEQAT
jgi:hypothetical protein